MPGFAIAEGRLRPIFLSIDSFDYRAICLFCACMIYALLGSPTPSHFGLAEMMVGVFLALSVGIGRFSEVLTRPVRGRFWKSAGQVFLVYGLVFPSCVGVMRGADAGMVLRDLIPFLFLFLPVFLLPTIQVKPYYFRSMLFAVVLIGLFFSMRSILMRNPAMCSIWCTSELLYLENMPSVLFCALFLMGSGVRFLMGGISGRSLLIFAGLIFLALLPVAAMAATMQRASLGAVVLYGAVIYGYFVFKVPARALAAGVVIAMAAGMIGISFGHIFEELNHKTALVGLNMRPQEFAAVWEVVRGDWLSLFFGIGWGGQFHSPAVGGLSVNFTHNFFTSIVLKTGLCGLLLANVYIFALLERLGRVILRDPVLGMALAAPIFIDLTLYASFKSLDFGLVLLMVPGALVYLRQSES